MPLLHLVLRKRIDGKLVAETIKFDNGKTFTLNPPDNDNFKSPGVAALCILCVKQVIREKQAENNTQTFDELDSSSHTLFQSVKAESDWLHELFGMNPNGKYLVRKGSEKTRHIGWSFQILFQSR